MEEGGHAKGGGGVEEGGGRGREGPAWSGG